jgi:hypothetical protein
MDNASELETVEQLDQAHILDANTAALNLFDFREKPLTWGELVSGLPEKERNGKWREELFWVIKRISLKRTPGTIQQVFETHKAQTYRPVACAVQKLGRNSKIESFDITFAEEVGFSNHFYIPVELSRLSLCLRYTFRFRWEVLEKFHKAPFTEVDALRLENTLHRIRADAKAQGMQGLEGIRELFTPEEAARIEKMYHEWRRVSNPEGTGELDLAITNRNLDLIPELLSRFIPANEEFIEMAAARFAQMVSSSDR